jgi:hypothetical protein
MFNPSLTAIFNFKMITICRVNKFKVIFFFLIFLLVLTHATDIEANDKTEDLFREIKLGVLLHDVGGLWSGSSKETGTDFNAEIILSYSILSICSGTIYPNFGLLFNDSGNTSNLYFGAIWDRKILSTFFINLGLGIAAHNGEIETKNEDKKSLGSSVLFRIPVEFGYIVNKHHRLSLFFVHHSNAYLAHPNEGMDCLGLRYSYQF